MQTITEIYKKNEKIIKAVDILDAGGDEKQVFFLVALTAIKHLTEESGEDKINEWTCFLFGHSKLLIITIL